MEGRKKKREEPLITQMTRIGGKRGKDSGREEEKEGRTADYADDADWGKRVENGEFMDRIYVIHTKMIEESC